jgi:hypothetical protein
MFHKMKNVFRQVPKTNYLIKWRKDAVESLIPNEKRWFSYKFYLIGFEKKLERDEFKDTDYFGVLPLTEMHNKFVMGHEGPFTKDDRQYLQSIERLNVAVSLRIHTGYSDDKFSIRETTDTFRNYMGDVPKSEFGSERKIIGHVCFNSTIANSAYRDFGVGNDYIPLLDFVLFMSKKESRIFSSMVRDNLQRNDQHMMSTEVFFREMPSAKTIVKKSINSWQIFITGIWYDSYLTKDLENLRIHPNFESF